MTSCQISTYLPEDLYGQVAEIAASREISLSHAVREIVERSIAVAADDKIDELRSTVIQIAAMLAVSIGKRSPELLEQGLADGRILLEQRGLLERSVKP